MSQPAHPPLLARQRGMTLVIVLIFLLLLTLLGVGSMSTSNMQERMASNAQSQTGAFQTAESAIAQVIADNTAFDAVMSSSGMAPAINTVTIGGVPTTATTSFVRKTPVLGGSLGLDSPLASYNFSIDSNATIAATGAHAQNVQEIEITGPNL